MDQAHIKNIYCVLDQPESQVQGHEAQGVLYRGQAVKTDGRAKTCGGKRRGNGKKKTQKQESLATSHLKTEINSILESGIA